MFISQAYLQRISEDKQRHLHATHVSLGYHPETYDELFLPDTDRYAGTYVLGVQGTGKSSLLENMIAFDHKANNAIIVIDPHGDLITYCLAELPPHRLSHTYLLDLEDAVSYPFGLNLFHVGTLDNDIVRTQAVSRIMHVFEVLWPDVLSQQHLPRYLLAACLTLLANPGSTLVDMYQLLLDEQFRARMLQQVLDPTVRQFWQVQYDALSEKERVSRVQPLIGRLESLFMGRGLVRNIVGQRQTTITFRTAIENREVLLIRLPLKSVKQDAQLIGTILLAQIHAAVFSFANIAQAKRPGVSIYLDEFQNFSTKDITELFTEGRKYGTRLTVAHQFRGQLPQYLQEATITARTKVVFQTTPEDGREMASVFPPQEESIKPEDIEPHPVNYLLTYGSDHPAVREFIKVYLRPLQFQKRGGKVDIAGTHLTFDLWNGIKPHDDLYVSDPTPYLDNLLYTVMKSGNAQAPIPPEAVLGFANSGRGFFSQARGLTNGHQLLRADVDFPAALVVMGANGEPRWTRVPESGREQLYHLLFHLRLTMMHLATEPIGKKTAPSTTVVGQMLTQLPRRAAFVRSGETVGVIYTNDTPQRVTGNELQLRAQAVLTQTRQKYCHPRKEVERSFLEPEAGEPANASSMVQADAPAMQPPMSRWEVRNE